ncbi:MAG: RidA family protein [Clostridia bacterium]|nr:RidA family protein [Clostridia bacterium]
MKQVYHTDNAPAAIGPYSQAAGGSGLVFVSGQLPINPATGELVSGSMAEQTRQCMNNIKNILAAAGCTLEDVVKTSIFLKDIGDFAEVNAAYAEFFPGEAPARACVQVAVLPKDGRIEIEAIAVK